MSRKTLYEYAVLHHQKVEEETETCLLIKPTMMIARKLPENLLDDLDNVEIIIRPF